MRHPKSWEKDFETEVTQVQCEGADSPNLVHNTIKWRVHVNMITNFPSLTTKESEVVNWSSSCTIRPSTHRAQIIPATPRTRRRDTYSWSIYKALLPSQTSVHDRISAEVWSILTNIFQFFFSSRISRCMTAECLHERMFIPFQHCL